MKRLIGKAESKQEFSMENLNLMMWRWKSPEPGGTVFFFDSVNNEEKSHTSNAKINDDFIADEIARYCCKL